MRGYIRFVLAGLLIMGLFTDPTTITGDTQIFNVSVNETCNVTWYMDGSIVDTDTSVIFAEYSNAPASADVYNITAIAENLNGTDQKIWSWTVNNPPAPVVTLSNPPSSPVPNYVGESRTFTATVNQDANVTWILNGNTLFTNTTTQTASYYNSSAQLGVHNLTVIAENANGTDQEKWTWTVTDAPVPVVTLSDPSDSSVPNYVGESRTFTATVNQDANVTWILNDATLFTNTSTQTASYYNSSAQLGTHNLTVFAENANGTDQEKWTWTVTNVALSIDDYGPDDSNIETTVGDSQTFNITTNQDATTIWYINGDYVETDSSTKFASYVDTTASVGSYNVTAIASNANGTKQQTWSWDVRSKTYLTGDRIWDALTDPSNDYTWTALTYSGFYYDLDSG